MSRRYHTGEHGDSIAVQVPRNASNSRARRAIHAAEKAWPLYPDTTPPSPVAKRGPPLPKAAGGASLAPNAPVSQAPERGGAPHVAARNGNTL